VDFIFGQAASIWITKSVIRTIGDGFIAASGRSTDDATWFVIDQSSVKGSGQLYLGRPWRTHARVVFQYTSLDVNIVEGGWSIWTPSDPRTSDIIFGEHLNTGCVTSAADIEMPSTDLRGSSLSISPGAWCPERATFATNLTSAVSIKWVY
jgi:pectinesterase